MDIETANQTCVFWVPKNESQFHHPNIKHQKLLFSDLQIFGTIYVRGVKI
jgi:hypothetical protein